MKRWFVAATAVSLITTAGVAEPRRPRDGDQDRDPRPGGHGFFGREMGDRPTTAVLEMMTKRLELTKEQQEKIAPILERTRSEIRETAEGTKAILEKTREEVGAVLNEEQKQKIGKAREDVKGAVGGFLKSHGPEIREGVKGAGDEIRLRIALRSLDLTDEQKAKLGELQESIEEKREAAMAEMRKQQEQIREEAKKVVDETLTDAQKAELKKKLADMPGPQGNRFGPGRERAAR